VASKATVATGSPRSDDQGTGVGVRTRMIFMDKTCMGKNNTGKNNMDRNNGEALSSVPRSRRTNGNSDRPVLTLHTGIACAENPIEPRIEGEAH
jgi:hypothetical protein